MITQEKIKELFKYYPLTGIFIRRKNRGRFKKGELVGTFNDKGYVYTMIKGKNFMLHRLAWLYVYGEMPKGEIDHINHIRTDNRIENLRVVNRQENSKNTSKRKDNTSGVTGVSFKRDRKRWEAYISIDGKKTGLGYFTRYSEAVDARKNAEVLYGYHKNHGGQNGYL